MSNVLSKALLGQLQKSLNLNDKQFAVYLKEQRRVLDREYSKAVRMLQG